MSTLDTTDATEMLKFYKGIADEEVVRGGGVARILDGEGDLTIGERIVWIMLGKEKIQTTESADLNTLIATINRVTDERKPEEIPLSIIPEIHAMVEHILELDIGKLMEIRKNALAKGVSSYQFNQILEAFLRGETNIESRDNLQSTDYQKVLNSLLEEFPNHTALVQLLKSGINKLQQYMDGYISQKQE